MCLPLVSQSDIYQETDSVWLIYNLVMRRNLILILAFFAVFTLGFNSFKRILTLRGTSEKVASEEMRLERLRQENEALKRDLEYKRGSEFAEKEIRDKLGLSKEGEEVVLVPKEQANQPFNIEDTDSRENWEKWRDLFFGS